MGIEKVTMTAKVDIENRIWLEGLRQNVFPFVTMSALINLLFTYLRLSNASGAIRLTPQGLQDLLCFYEGQDLQRKGRIPMQANPKQRTTHATTYL